MKDFYENQISNLEDAKQKIDAMFDNGLMPEELHDTVSQAISENTEQKQHILEKHVLKPNKANFH